MEKTPGSLWHYHKDDLNNNITASELFRFNVRITRAIPAGGNTKDVEIALPLE